MILSVALFYYFSVNAFVNKHILHRGGSHRYVVLQCFISDS